MQFDYEKYRSKLRPLGYTEDDLDEVIEFMWNMVGAQIDIAFNQNPIQNSQTDIADSNLQSHNSIVGSSETNNKEAHTRTVH